MSDNHIKTREEKWQKNWRTARVFVPKNDDKKPKYYNLIEFPFPSGAGLHGGHMLGDSGMDVMARFKRMQGFDVLYPIGFDSFGIQAENYAVKLEQHPSVVVAGLVKKFSAEMEKLGLSVDPNSHISSTDPEFMKWTQWMFIRFFNAGLAYKAPLPMNWCPKCRTTLTNEELDDGKCNRCNSWVEKRDKMQWNLAMTKYAQRLLDDLELVDYPERVKRDQINWIGKSTGADLDFHVGEEIMTVYTTRVDTIFGATFCVIAPEHKLVAKWLAGGRIENADEVRAYITETKQKSEFDRTDASREKTGVRLLGLMAKNPYTETEIPIFIADYVLIDYAHGTIMAVPAHDQRDWDFAKKFNLPIIPVLAGGDVSIQAWEQDGEHINSGFMNGMNKEDAIDAAIKIGEKGGFARSTVRHKMRDWGFSRQMYWGEPIPLVHCEKCGWVSIPDDQLPLMLPHIDDYRPTEDGESPLARATDWVNTTCPKCGCAARRETDTMPGWAGSSWYYMRYLDAKNDREFCRRSQLDKWMPVDHYNGGNEHNTRHLLYSRFWYKVLFDLGMVPAPEPYARRTTNGLLLGTDGKKMSKSTGNGFLVSEKLDEIGADAARMTVLALGPWENNIIWSEGTLAGVQKFLKRVESFSENLTDDTLTGAQEFFVNDLIAKMTYRIENMQFNTAISAMMEFINGFDGKTCPSKPKGQSGMPRRAYEVLIQVLNPFAPHLTEEMWEKLGHKEMLVFEPWPIADKSKLVRATQTLAVSVNGKRRTEITVAVDVAESDVVAIARESVTKYITGDIARTIVVPGKLVNFVLKG